MTREQENRLPVIEFKVLAEGDGPFYPSVPVRSRPGDAGFDLYVSRTVDIPFGTTVDVHTDIAIALPEGYYGRITGRSSTLRNRGLLVNEGIIDSGYRGEMFIAIHNLRGYTIRIQYGDRLAQLLVQKIYEFEWKEVVELPKSLRGTLGFGSTGQ